MRLTLLLIAPLLACTAPAFAQPQQAPSGAPPSEVTAATTATPAPTAIAQPLQAPPSKATSTAATTAAPTPAPTAAPAPVAPVEPPSRRRVRLALGFGHWFGSTVGFPMGFSTPSISVGVRPGLSFMELRAQYTFSTKSLTLPSGTASHVGFAMLELLANREMRMGNQRLNAYAGVDGVLTHAGAVGYGFGLVLGAEYLFATGLPLQNSFGIFMNAREVFYYLPKERTRLDLPEAQIDLGLVMTLL